MENEIVQIEIYDEREKSSESVIVEKLNDKKFRVAENAVFNYRLTFGTEFETRINADSKYEIIGITKDSGSEQKVMVFIYPQMNTDEHR